jgi:GT2 family glycosyltransferase
VTSTSPTEAGGPAGREIPRRLDLESVEPRPVRAGLTVVIPTLGRPILESCLAALAAGTAWPARIVVVDQGREPRVAAWLEGLAGRGLPTLHVPSGERGRSAGVNRGIERVETAHVAVTDDDCLVAADWVERMADRFDASPATVVSGRVDAAEGTDVPFVVAGETASVQRRPRLLFDSLCGGNMGAAVEVVRRVGPFDEDPRLRTAEDGDWAYRALRAGVPIAYAPEIRVTHVGWRDEAESLAQYRSYARSHGGFYGKHLRRGDPLVALRVVLHLARSLRRWLRGAIRGDAKQAALGRAYFTGLLPGVVAGLRGPRG